MFDLLTGQPEPSERKPLKLNQPQAIPQLIASEVGALAITDKLGRRLTNRLIQPCCRTFITSYLQKTQRVGSRTGYPTCVGYLTLHIYTHTHRFTNLLAKDH